MDKIIIFGTTNHSHMIRSLIEREEAAEVIGYTVDIEEDSNYPNNIPTECEGYPLVPFGEIENYYHNSEYKILNTIGYTQMNQIRKVKNEECLKKGYELFSFVSKDAIMLSELCGIGNIILPGAYLGPNVTLGDGNVVYTGCILTHDIRVGSNSFLAAGCTIGGNTEIGNNCFLGMNSTIKNSVKVADYSLVGASTYINRDTEEFGVYVPALPKKLEKSSLHIRL